jgi:hypothetical protein
VERCFPQSECPKPGVAGKDEGEIGFPVKVEGNELWIVDWNRLSCYRPILISIASAKTIIIEASAALDKTWGRTSQLLLAWGL